MRRADGGPHGMKIGVRACIILMSIFAGGCAFPGGPPEGLGLTLFVLGCKRHMGGSFQSCFPLFNSGYTTTVYGPANGSTATGDADGCGLQARFNGSASAAIDLNGNMYVTDFYGHRIRKIDLFSGCVSTFAGAPPGVTASGDTDGSSTAARFFNPVGISTDGEYLYVGDFSNHKIRRISIADASVSTFAGPPSGNTTSGDMDGFGNAARFFNPASLVVVGQDLFVADYLNNKVRKVNLATAAVTTIAGPAQGAATSGDTDAAGTSSRFNGPIGVTGDGRALYISDRGNNKIRRIDMTGYQVTTIAGPAQGSTTSGDVDGIGNSARISTPEKLTTDGFFLYFPSSSDSKIKRLHLGTSEVSTLAGPPAGASGTGDLDGAASMARFNGIGSVATDGWTVYVPEIGNNKIRALR